MPVMVLLIIKKCFCIGIYQNYFVPVFVITATEVINNTNVMVKQRHIRPLKIYYLLSIARLCYVNNYNISF